MAEFIDGEAMDVDDDGNDSEKGEDVATVSDNEFIDDSEQKESGYCYFTNVTRSYDDVM